MPAPGSLLIAVKAAGLDPSAAKNVLGRMPQTKVPRIPGRDFAGIVEVGTEAYPIGSEVFGSGGTLGFTHDGSHAEYIEVPAEAVQPKPRPLTFEQAASAGIPYLTAGRAIIDVLPSRRAKPFSSPAPLELWEMQQLALQSVFAERQCNQSHLIGVDSIHLSFEDSGRILGSLLPYFESRDFGPK